VLLQGLTVRLPSGSTLQFGPTGIARFGILHRPRSAARLAVEQLEHFATPVTHGEAVRTCAADRLELVSHADLVWADGGTHRNLG